MTADYPIPIPQTLPARIDPCPIVEAIFELRFITDEPWRTLPGLLARNIREHYPEQRDLPLAAMPDQVRRQMPMVGHLPVMQFVGREFIVQLGPKTISLVTLRNAYPGWHPIQKELGWLLEQCRACGFIREGERLGLRYVDYFAEDVFSNLILSLKAGTTLLAGNETQVTAVLKRPPFTLRLLVTNAATVGFPDGPKRGSILDIDASVGALDFEVFKDTLTRFDEGHLMVKQLFFGLLKPEFEARLNPTYE